MNTISKSREATDVILPFSSGASTEAPALPSEPSATAENTPTSTPTMSLPSGPILPAAATPELSEKVRQHADLMRVALLQLEKAGLCKRYQVLSEPNDEGQTHVVEIQVAFPPEFWTTGLELR